jgi:NAD(P)-dependent dehydrogenase (short-subunit alcohol dehydrogenase family)
MMGNVAIVTGVGARGQVGYAVAAALLRVGARVVVSARGEAVEALAGELEAGAPEGVEVAAVRADLGTGEGAAAVVAAASDRFGRLDLLVNVAGGLTLIKPIAETTTEELESELARNAKTVFLMCRAALPLLRESRGSIVNFASPAGLAPVANLGAYSAAKALVVSLTRSFALEEAANGVRVNAVAPGMIDTEQNRASAAPGAKIKWVSREQIAEAVLYLAGASAVTGEVLAIRGAS